MISKNQVVLVIVSVLFHQYLALRHHYQRLSSAYEQIIQGS